MFVPPGRRGLASAIVLRRIGPALLALLVLAAGACGDAVTPAIRVGDHEVSEADFLEEVEEFAGNEVVTSQQSPEGGAPGSYSAEFVTLVAQSRIELEVFKIIAEELDVELTDADLDAARDVIGTELLDGFSSGFAESYVEDVALASRAQEELGDEAFGPRVQQVLAEHTIEVSSRFGTWDDGTRQVVPPEGPATADA